MDFKKIRSGFTLLEVMMALSIILMLWGSTGIFLKRLMKETGRVFNEEKGRIDVVLLKCMEKDSISLLEKIQNSKKEMILRTLKGSIIYEFDRGYLYRSESDQKRVMIENIKSVDWKFLSQGRWFDDWDEEKLPEAILWVLEKGEKTTNLLCPIYQEKSS